MATALLVIHCSQNDRAENRADTRFALVVGHQHENVSTSYQQAQLGHFEVRKQGP
jgi:hypothetical protein